MTTKLLFLLLRAGLNTLRREDLQFATSFLASKIDRGDAARTSAADGSSDSRTDTLGEIPSFQTAALDWQAIYRLAIKQGVAAFAWDGLEVLRKTGLIPIEQLPQRSLRLQWAFNTEQIEQHYAVQYRAAAHLAAAYAEAGLQTFVLKGIAVAQLYPVPKHRPCGDLDCFLIGKGRRASEISPRGLHPRPDYEAGNVIAERLGAHVERDVYKHSHIVFEGLTVENHQYCTAIRGSSKTKAFERELQRLLCETSPTQIKGSALLSPSPLFTALFLTIHARTHFLSEGISLRHLTDWAVLLHCHSAKIDWLEFRGITEAHDAGMYHFAQSMTRLATQWLGTAPVADLDLQPQEIDRRLFEDIVRPKQGLYNRGLSPWRQRKEMLRNFWVYRWRVAAYGCGSLLRHVLHLVGGFLFERCPRL